MNSPKRNRRKEHVSYTPPLEFTPPKELKSRTHSSRDIVEPETTELHDEKSFTFFDTLLNGAKFFAVTTIIFFVSFTALNFQAYVQIAKSFFFPEAQRKTEIAMNKSVKETKKQQKLLQIERKRREVQKRFPPLDLKIAPPDNRIIIPKIGQNIPLINVNTELNDVENKELIGKEIEGAIQEGLKNGAIHYPGTAAPGQFGNFFVTGHSSYYPWDHGRYKDVFAMLSSLETGDEYYVYYNQKKYTYKIYEKKEVRPGEISVLDQPKDQKIGTLMTCTPIGTNLRRLIIHGQLVEDKQIAAL